MLRAFILLLITTLLTVAAAWWYMNETAVNEAESERQAKVEEGFLTTRNDFNDKMEDFKRRKNELLVQIERFEIRKKKASQQLKEMGIKTAADLDGNDDARRKFNSIRQDQADIAKLNEDIVLFDEAISAIESGLRELERKDLLENVGVNDATYGQLRTIVKDLDDRLSKPESALDKLETQSILDDILGSDDPD